MASDQDPGHPDFLFRSIKPDLPANQSVGRAEFLLDFLACNAREITYFKKLKQGWRKSLDSSSTTTERQGHSQFNSILAWASSGNVGLKGRDDEDDQPVD